MYSETVTPGSATLRRALPAYGGLASDCTQRLRSATACSTRLRRSVRGVRRAGLRTGFMARASPCALLSPFPAFGLPAERFHARPVLRPCGLCPPTAVWRLWLALAGRLVVGVRCRAPRLVARCVLSVPRFRAVYFSASRFHRAASGTRRLGAGSAGAPAPLSHAGGAPAPPAVGLLPAVAPPYGRLRAQRCFGALPLRAFFSATRGHHSKKGARAAYGVTAGVAAAAGATPCSPVPFGRPATGGRGGVAGGCPAGAGRRCAPLSLHSLALHPPDSPPPLMPPLCTRSPPPRPHASASRPRAPFFEC